MDKLISRLTLIILVFLLAGFSLLGWVVLNIKSEIQNLSQKVNEIEIQEILLTNPTDTETSTPTLFDSSEVSVTDEIQKLKLYIDEKIASLPTQPASTKPVITQKTKQTSYIPMGESFTTASTSWVDVPGSEVYIDLTGDYGLSAIVSWSCSLKVNHANGQTFARIYDATNNIAVDGSELSVKNVSTYQQVSSGNLALWRGRNLYKVQIKSLNSFEASYSSGKIKISY